MEKKAIAESGTQPPQPPHLNIKYHHINPIGPRYQWEHNKGYCGEVSLISAGLYYGQYLSQYDVRTMAWASQDQAARDKTKHSQQGVQVLLGINDAAVAQMLKLDAETCEVGNSVAFMKWVKKNVVDDNPVIIGVFNNEHLIYKDDAPAAGDDEYDHIVPVLGWGSSRPLDENDISGDVILLSDNGLYGPDVTPVPDHTVDYYYHYHIPYFLADRELANTQDDDNRVYSLLSLSDQQSGKRNYGVAIRGVLDENSETLPVRLTTSINYEAPQIAKNSDTRPDWLWVTLTITVSDLTPGQTYNLYYYTDEADVPAKNFNAPPGEPWQQIEATATTWTGTLTIKSKDKAFFRAVNKNAG